MDHTIITEPFDPSAPSARLRFLFSSQQTCSTRRTGQSNEPAFKVGSVVSLDNERGEIRL